jgi:low affinity Fe/Cu permease
LRYFKRSVCSQVRSLSNMAKHPTRVHKAGLTLNDRVAILFGNLLGSPWAIYLFIVIAFVSLPEVIRSNDIVLIIGWLAQTFIQLVALAILQAKAVIDGKHSEAVANEIYNNAVLSEKQNEEILDMIQTLKKSVDSLRNLDRKIIKKSK